MPYAVYDCGCGHRIDRHGLIFEPVAGQPTHYLICLEKECMCRSLVRGYNKASVKLMMEFVEIKGNG